MLPHNKATAIGIWGIGRVGSSALHFLIKQGYHNLSVLAKEKAATPLERLLTTYNISYSTDCSAANITQFLHNNTHIIPSPGIDLRPYAMYAHKWLVEVDIFQHLFNDHCTAITGTTGKTTITTLLKHLLDTTNISLQVGGNIGTPMLELITPKKQPSSPQALLEVSSFQLEHAHIFAPDLAILTNFSANHLDRHTTITDYLCAKKKILTQQTVGQKALVPHTLFSQVCTPKSTRAATYLFCPHPPTHHKQTEWSKHCAGFFYLDKQTVMACNNQGKHSIVGSLTSAHTTLTFLENWLIVLAAYYLITGQNPILPTNITTLELPEHRMEYVATINECRCYNDSKATTPDATIAAVKKLAQKKIILLLGGLSKGIDRRPLFAELKNRVASIYCFGAEAEQLATFARAHALAATAYQNLEQTVHVALQDCAPGYVLLFSPAGSSFDLFENYQERGIRFKQLVMQHKKKNGAAV